MQRVLGIPQSETESASKGEVRWIERLQKRPLSAPAPSTAVDAPEAGLWIMRLQQRAGGQAR